MISISKVNDKWSPYFCNKSILSSRKLLNFEKMATSHNSIPEVIDDDVQRTTEHILRSLSEEKEDTTVLNLEPELRRRLTEAVCVALQTERNAWKEKNQHTLHEIDRQHKASIVIESALQDLVSSLGLQKEMDSPPTSGRRSSNAINRLQRYITSLRTRVEESKDNQEMLNLVEQLKDNVSNLKEEKEKQAIDLKDKVKETLWLQSELNTVRHQLTKLRRIVLNYNQSHSTNFHLEEESTETGGHRSQSDPVLSRERTYVEGDQLNYFSTSGEEIVVWKLRNKQARDVGGVYGSGGSTSRGFTRGGGGGGGRNNGVTQCLRCNQLFKPAENNNKACQFHKKGRQIREQYDPSGRLLRVLYTWACCKKGLDAPGCTHGSHI